MPRRDARENSEESKHDAMKAYVTELKTLPQEQKERAAKAIANYASHAENGAVLVKAGALFPLVAMLQASTDGGKTAAALALAYLGRFSSERQQAIGKAGAIEPLVALLRSGSNKSQQQAANALSTLSAVPELKPPMVKAGIIPPLVRLVRTGIDDAKIPGALTIANICDGHGDHAARADAQSKVAAAGAVPLLLAMLPSGKTQMAAAHALARLCARHADNQALVRGRLAPAPLSPPPRASMPGRLRRPPHSEGRARPDSRLRRSPWRVASPSFSACSTVPTCPRRCTPRRTSATCPSQALQGTPEGPPRDLRGTSESPPQLHPHLIRSSSAPHPRHHPRHRPHAGARRVSPRRACS
jgi:hypothetical protein